MTSSGGAEVEARRARVAALLARPSSRGTFRFVVSVGVGLVVGVVVALTTALRYGVLSGLMAVAAAYVVWTYLAVRRFKGQGTYAHAGREDPNILVRDVGITMVIVGNLGAVVALLVLDQGRSQGNDVDAAFAVGSVLLSWFLLHTLYAPHYARLFYGRPDEGVPPLVLHEPLTGEEVTVAGGIDFNVDGYWPMYADFTYFAFNLGMTFQVSDTAVKSPAIRRLVLGHSLLSYFFATAITATVINLVIGLVG
ncbi:DUF1345 domain-containing protein [Microlunatus spumicola]|uniref:DUF1345 domain-containing protein n=1 Tax=Microlunatus spumicola TaxID=81499 RepID=A0ABP6Y831_9ACTN